MGFRNALIRANWELTMLFKQGKIPKQGYTTSYGNYSHQAYQRMPMAQQAQQAMPMPMAQQAQQAMPMAQQAQQAMPMAQQAQQAMPMAQQAQQAMPMAQQAQQAMPQQNNLQTSKINCKSCGSAVSTLAEYCQVCGSKVK